MTASTTVLTDEERADQLSNMDIEDTFDKKKFDKMDYARKQKYANELEDRDLIYRTKTRIYIIQSLAEALEKQEYPILEIKEKIIEGFEGRVSSHYIIKCLPERFKRPQNVTSGKKSAEARKKQKQANINSATGQLLEEPELQFKEDDEEEENDESEDYTGGSNKHEPLPDIQPSIAYSEDYVQTLEQQVKAMKGSLPYKDVQATQRIAKLSKQTLIKLEEASKKATKEVYTIIDTRTLEIIEVYSDKDYKKLTNNRK